MATALLRHPLWSAGMVVAIGGYVLQALVCQLLAQDGCVPAVLCKFAQHVEVRQRSGIGCRRRSRW